MDRVYIKKLAVSGGSHVSSILEFSPGLNIIIGPSNTGKSLIVDCIDYIFGRVSKKNDRPKIELNSNGYTAITLTIATSNGDITFTREIGKNKIIVDSLNKEIESGPYSLDTAAKKNINSLFLKLIGIENDHQVLKNTNGDTVSLTWRLILYLFLMKQSEIDRPSSALLSTNIFNKTASAAALLFLLTGQDFNEISAPEKKEIAQAKKKAIMRYIREKKDELVLRRNDLTRKLAGYDIPDLEETINQTQKDLSEIQNELNKALIKSQEYYSEIQSKSSELAQCITAIQSFENLENQYSSDINRLEFIIRGKLSEPDEKIIRFCPLCNSEVKSPPDSNQITAAKEELIKIQSKMSGLIKAQEAVLSKRNNVEQAIQNLNDEKFKIDEKINKELQPSLENFQDNLQKSIEIIQWSQELEIIKQNEKNYNHDLSEKEKESDPKPGNFHIAEYYDLDLVEEYENELVRTLEACQIGGASSAHLNLATFEIEIDNRPKDACMGGGYSALLNTLVV